MKSNVARAPSHKFDKTNAIHNIHNPTCVASISYWALSNAVWNPNALSIMLISLSKFFGIPVMDILKPHRLNSSNIATDPLIVPSQQVLPLMVLEQAKHRKSTPLWFLFLSVNPISLSQTSM